MKEQQHHHPHGPENAEHEIKKAYNHTIETGVTFCTHCQEQFAKEVNPDEVTQMYKKAYNALRSDERLKSERWARTAKHLARAFWHEAKIAYLRAHGTELPFLTDAHEEYHLHEYSDTTADLLESVAGHPPRGQDRMPEEMNRYLVRGRTHLDELEALPRNQELLRAEHIKAAHEYGRVVECLALAYESESQNKAA